MFRALLAVLIPVALAGCATPEYWVPWAPHAERAKFVTDNHECMGIAYETHPETQPVDFVPVVGIVSGTSRAMDRADLYNDCMDRRGYRKISEVHNKNLIDHVPMWVSPGAQLPVFVDSASCHQAAGLAVTTKPGELNPEYWRGLTRCMRAKGYRLWTKPEAESYGSAPLDRQPAIAQCMAAADDAFPLDVTVPVDLSARRQMYGACMAEKGYQSAGG